MGRNLTTTRSQVFGDVRAGTQCRVCGRDVDDGRRKHCSDYCSNIVSAVMSFLNWPSVRKRIIERDDQTCQRCGYDHGRRLRAREHVRELIDEYPGEQPESPSMLRLGRGEVSDAEFERARTAFRAWRRCRERARERYGEPDNPPRELEVDHITPVADGGHPFNPENLQTLCSHCHQDKTSSENSERAERQTPSRGDLSESITEYL